MYNLILKRMYFVNNVCFFTSILMRLFIFCLYKEIIVMKIVQCVSSMMITLLSGVVLMQLLCVTAEGLTTVAVSGVMSAVDNTTCEYIRIECALHEGCNQALQNYFEKCDRILKANSTTCPESCMNALVALTSTVQGSGLLDVSITYK